MNERIEQWEGRRVWIIGASSGIGRALARTLLERGARVALSARRREALAEIADVNPAALVLPFDIAEPGAAAAAFSVLAERWGGVDLVACVAGAYRPVRAWTLTPEVIREMVSINVIGVMEVAAAVLPALLSAGRGGILIVSSVAGYRGLPKALVYGPTKAALINFAEALHLDLAPKGVSVYLVDPGFVATPLTAKNDFRMPALITSEEAARSILKGLAAGRFEIHFPRRFTLWMKLLRMLPHGLYVRAVRRIVDS